MGRGVHRSVLVTAVVGGAVLSSLAAGAGVAAADDYSGKKYSDVTAALADAGKKGVIATRSGDALADDDCVVTSSSQAPWLKGDDFSPVTDTVLLNLDCNAAVATAATPGNSAASPQGRAALQDAKSKAAKSSAPSS